MREWKFSHNCIAWVVSLTLSCLSGAAFAEKPNEHLRLNPSVYEKMGKRDAQGALPKKAEEEFHALSSEELCDKAPQAALEVDPKKNQDARKRCLAWANKRSGKSPDAKEHEHPLQGTADQYCSRSDALLVGRISEGDRQKAKHRCAQDFEQTKRKHGSNRFDANTVQGHPGLLAASAETPEVVCTKHLPIYQGAAVSQAGLGSCAKWVEAARVRSSTPAREFSEQDRPTEFKALYSAKK